MLSSKMIDELIRLAQMQTRAEEDDDAGDRDDAEIDGQIELARRVLDDLNIKY